MLWVCKQAMWYASLGIYGPKRPPENAPNSKSATPLGRGNSFAAPKTHTKIESFVKTCLILEF